MILRGAVLARVLAAACGDDTTTLRMWAMGREGELVAALIPAFERAHPGVRVEIQQLPWTSAHEKLLTAFVGDATPDLAQLGNTWLPELAALDALAPLDDRVAASTVIQPADYFAGIWETNVVDNPALPSGCAASPGQAGLVERQRGAALYGIPWYVDTRVLFYRSDLFARAGYPAMPTTWDAWRAAMQRIKAQGSYGVLLPLDEFEQLIALALQTGDDMLADDGTRGHFAGPGFRRALTFYLQLFIDGLAPTTTQIQVPNPWDELARGYFASFLHGPWSIEELQRRLPASQQALWATASLPGPDGPGVSAAGGSSLVVFRRSKHADAAWQLVEYLSRPDVQRAFYQLTNNLPPRRASWTDPKLASDPHVQTFRAQLERVRRLPPVPEWERIATELRFASERAARQVSASTTPAQLAQLVDATVRALDGRADEILEKRRWMRARRGAAR